MPLNLIKALGAGDPLTESAIREQIANYDPNLLKTSARRELDIHTSAYVTVDPATKEMLKAANLLAFRNEPILILGETGTGKELVANILNSQRFSDKGATSISVGQPVPITPINCSGLTETLFESLVFGHTRGSFTGAVSDEPGLLRAAENGTAFFDEVNSLPLSQQAKLLRVLQTNKVRPVGSTIEHTIECRFVFASNQCIKTMVNNGTFRADLYYRISKAVLHTRPLRERLADIPLIVQAIYNKYGWSLPSVLVPPPEAYDKGNVRQLENYLYRREVLAMTSEQAIIDL